MRRLLFLAVVMALALTAQVSLFEMYGSLQSPNFPEPYPRETQLRWNVSVPDGFQVQLYFSHFDLEPSYLCEYDFVKVEAEGEVLGLFCGRSQTDTEAVPDQQVMTSPKNSLSVVFTSDFSNEERHSGFRAHYRAVDVDECSERTDEDLICDHFCHNYIGGYYCSCRHGYLLHTDNRTCRVECSDGVFRERSGVLSSVDFPAPYPKSSECLYRIEAEPGFKLRLQFDPSFDVEDHPDVRCPYDYVKITAGPTQFGPFCGSVSPGILQTDSNIVSVSFHSDDSGENLGWRMTYTATGSRCPVPESPPNAVMNPVQSEYFFKDHVLVTCSHGYKLMKDAEVLDHLQLDCGPDGTWTSPPPRCELVDCGKPTAVEGADLLFGNHDNSTLFGSTVHYVCRGDTFHLNTMNMSLSCGPDGRWTSPESGAERPSCLQVCGRPSRALPAQVKRIVGGRGAAPGLFPWHALLSVEDASRVPEGRWFGSGALLSDSWVLTAAHVLRSQRRDASVVPVAPEHVKVFLGVHDARDKRPSSRRSVERVVLHPDFTPDNYDNDIALLKLASRVELNHVIRPICLPPPHNEHDPSSPLPNSLGIVAGWGISVPNATSPSSGAPPLLTSDLLQYVKLPVVSQDECRASYASRSVRYNITENMFCAGYFEGGRDTCMGDSGGAFVMEDKVSRRWMALGLVSWGGPEECGSQRVYGVYTRVTKYVEWIQQHLQAAPWW